ncbi:MAG: cytochrome ubiquinol oxidase subunit I [Pseudomonadota bacterium]|nr:cytochrome ubiquinol oxidase subunit I [Pseudomonadota bacterium]
MLDATLLSRIQFGFTMTAHIVYPSISIGIVSFLVLMEARYLATGDKHFLNICKFWTKIFALTFGMGVVSGIVMEFQFGTNWGGFSEKVGPLLGALFTYEVLTAFFVEAGFLGIMLFGWNKVDAFLHFVSTCMVAFGTTLSAFWIMSANSWMQTPVAYQITPEGQFMTQDWAGVILSPTAMTRFFHMIVSCYLTGAFVILGVSAFYLITKTHTDFAKTCFNTALVIACIFSPTQILIGHSVGEQVHHYQPLKTAAMEGIWDTVEGAPALIFAWPDQKAEKNYLELGIPKLASFINTGDWDAKMIGLKSAPPENRPNMFTVFWTFRIMVGCGLAMLFISYLGLILRFLGLHTSNFYFLALCVLGSPLGVIALETGWMTAEIGRQPWAVYNLLKTSEVASRVNPNQVLTSLILLIIVYGIIFGYFYFKYLFKVIAKGPMRTDDHSDLAFHYLSTFEDEVKHSEVDDK